MKDKSNTNGGYSSSILIFFFENKNLINTRAFLFFQIVFLFFSSPISAQKDSTTLNTKRLYPVLAATAVSYSAVMVGLSKVWYNQNTKTNFHFFNDAAEWKQMDKVGHLYTTFHESMFFAETYQWCGIKPKSSLWLGAATGFAIQSSIEIFDGYAANYGASISDVASNAIGSLGFAGQQLAWQEIRIVPKFSFHTSPFAAQRPNVLGSTIAEQIIKDYNGQTYWLAFSVNSFLKTRKIPSWIALSIGYGAENMIFARDDTNMQIGLTPYRRYFLALDLDLSRIKTRSPILKQILKRLNMVHLPGPAIEFNKYGVEIHGWYF